MTTESTTPDTYLKVATSGECLDGLNLTGCDPRLSAPLKITHVTGVHGSGLRLQQCRENAVDIDVSSDIGIAGRFGSIGVVPSAGQTITIKGGCRNVAVSGIVLSETGRQNSHVQVGNWMDQDFRPSSSVSLCLIHITGRPVNVVTGWVVPFSVKLSGCCKWLLVESVKLKLYIVAKFVIRFFLRIPKGTKGPAWF